jgi:predicted metal-dependent HD superfamily phosphohydrolase
MYDRPISTDANRDEIAQKMQGNYHKRLHIIDCLNEFYQVRHLIKNPDIIECAILFHDIIYDPTAKDNEENSAKFAEQMLTKRGLPKDFITEVVRYILGTKHDKASDTQDGKYLSDIDISIF